MNIRLRGTLQETQTATERLGEVFDIVAVSDPRPDRGRGRLVRVYVEVCLTPASPTPSVEPHQAAADRRGRRRPGRARRAGES